MRITVQRDGNQIFPDRQITAITGVPACAGFAHAGVEVTRDHGDFAHRQTHHFEYALSFFDPPG